MLVYVALQETISGFIDRMHQLRWIQPFRFQNMFLIVANVPSVKDTALSLPATCFKTDILVTAETQKGICLGRKKGQENKKWIL